MYIREEFQSMSILPKKEMLMRFCNEGWGNEKHSRDREYKPYLVMYPWQRRNGRKYIELKSSIHTIGSQSVFETDKYSSMNNTNISLIYLFVLSNPVKN